MCPLLDIDRQRGTMPAGLSVTLGDGGAMDQIRIAHLSDVHARLFRPRARSWRQRWDEIAHDVRSQRPDVTVITGDLLDGTWPGHWARCALDYLWNDCLRGLRDISQVIVLPGNHDSKRFFGLGGVRNSAAAIHRDVIGPQSDGWLEPTRFLHLFVAHADHSGPLANACVLPSVLESARIPRQCAQDHLHVFLLHHHLIPEPTRSRESPITTSHFALRLTNASTVLDVITGEGFDLVLHGHRHLATFHQYADPIRNRQNAWIVGAPSAMSLEYPGFNIIVAREDGTFDVHARLLSQDRWVHIPVAVRDYKQARTHLSRKLTADENVTLGEVVVSVETRTVAEKHLGDVKVQILLRHPNFGNAARFRFPFAQMVEYAAVPLRALRVRTDDGLELSVDDQGEINLERVMGKPIREIAIDCILLNAVPANHVDWARMRGSQTGLQNLFCWRLNYGARSLCVDVNLDGTERLILSARGARRRNHVPGELHYCVERTENNLPGHQVFVVFEPSTALTYCLEPASDFGVREMEPWELLEEPYRGLRRKIEVLASKASEPVRAAQSSLDRLRRNFLQVAEVECNDSLAASSDIGVHVFSVPALIPALRGAPEPASPGIRLALSEGPALAPQDRALRYGEGAAGRALRAGGWIKWSRVDRSGHPTTWPASDGHVRNMDYAHLLCGPIVFQTNGGPFAVAIIVFATREVDSLLGLFLRGEASTLGPRVDSVQRLVGSFAEDLAAALGASRPIERGN